MANLLNPNQKINLLTQVSPAAAAEGVRSRKYLIGAAFDALAVFATVAVSFFYFGYLTKQNSLAWVAACGAVFMAFHSIAFILTKSKWRRITVAALETAGLFSFFILERGTFSEIKPSYFVAMAAAVLFFLFWGERESRNEMENGLKFRFFKVTRPLLGKLVSALVLIGVLLSLPRIERDPNVFTSKSLLDISGWTVGLVQKIYPEFKNDDTVESIAERLAEVELSKNPNFQNLDANTREFAVTRAADEIIRNFQAQSGIALEDTGTLQSAIYQFMASKLKAWYESAPTAFLFIWAAALFFIFRGFGAVLSLGIAVIGYLIFQTLLAMNVIHLTGESRLHEMVEYS